jgi:UDP-N-acetyl-D-mannosaminuronic acid dehydrogenase
MPSILSVKPEDVDTAEKRAKYTVSVVGCGQRGILFANAFAEAGFSVICSDANASIAKKVAKGKTILAQTEVETKLKNNVSRGQICVSSERKKAVSQSDIIVIAVGAKINNQKKPDFTQIVSAAKQVGAALHQGSLVIYSGVASLGFVEGTLKETLENNSALKAGSDFGLAYSPTLGKNGSLTSVELKIAGIDQTSQEAAFIVLKTLTKKVKEAPEIKTAEAAALFSIARRDANRALANELAVFCENARIDYFKVLKQLDLNEQSFVPAVLEEENQEEAFLLLDNAEILNVKLRIPLLARVINAGMVKHAVNLTQNAMKRSGRTLRRAKIAVLGASNPVCLFNELIKALESKGAKICLYDPQLKDTLQDGVAVKNALSEAVEGSDCIMILSEHGSLKSLNLKKLRTLMKMPAVVMDLTGELDGKKVETEGFIYSGFGKES